MRRWKPMEKRNKIITNEPSKEDIWPRIRIAILSLLLGISIASAVLLPSSLEKATDLNGCNSRMDECITGYQQCFAWLNITMEKGRAITEEAAAWKSRCTAAQELGWQERDICLQNLVGYYETLAVCKMVLENSTRAG